MLHAEVFVYPGDKTGMFEYPSHWRDLVSGHELKAIMQIGLAAAEGGRFKTIGYVHLEKLEAAERIPLCEAMVHIRVHDLREYPTTEAGERIASWGDVAGETSKMTKRWSYAPTVDELYLMVDADLPRIAEIGRFLHGNRT